jgi:hypothetical protein
VLAHLEVAKTACRRIPCRNFSAGKLVPGSMLWITIFAEFDVFLKKCYDPILATFGGAFNQ